MKARSLQPQRLDGAVQCGPGNGGASDFERTDESKAFIEQVFLAELSQTV
jgi:hypothetical protein